MKVNFDLKQIAQIISMVKTYGVLYVTSEGQMFLKETDVVEAVKTKNMILDDPNALVGYVTLGAEMFTVEALHRIKRDVKEFNSVFGEARIPLQRNTSRDNDFERAKGSMKPATDVEKINEIFDLVEKQPEAKPIVPEAKPIVPEAKPIVPEAKPIVPEAKPIVPEVNKATAEAALNDLHSKK